MHGKRRAFFWWCEYNYELCVKDEEDTGRWIRKEGA